MPNSHWWFLSRLFLAEKSRRGLKPRSLRIIWFLGDFSKERDPTSSNSDDSNEFVEMLLDADLDAVQSINHEEWIDKLVEEALVQSNSKVLQKVQPSLRSKQSKLNPSMKRSLAIPNSSTVKENVQKSCANASGTAVLLMQQRRQRPLKWIKRRGLYRLGQCQQASILMCW